MAMHYGIPLPFQQLHYVEKRFREDAKWDIDASRNLAEGVVIIMDIQDESFPEFRAIQVG
jgi:hypothetical protein